jgi:Ser/Thr protein kinase RdoA (MazF antagonist)
VPFAPTDEDEVRASTLFQESAYAAGVPTPEVRRTIEGDVLAEVDVGQARVYEWVDLLACDPRLDPALVGAAVGRIHQLPGAVGGAPDPWFQDPVGPGRWDQLITQLRVAGAPFAGRLAALRDELVELESWIEPPQVLQTCHRDLWADNVLPTKEGGLCVIDWENSGPADPDQELGSLLFEFARGDAGRARELMAAYREAGGHAVVSRRGHFSMLVATLGHVTEIAATDWLTPNVRSPDRADSAAWISEILDEPHTPDVLDSLLVAVAGSST